MFNALRKYGRILAAVGILSGSVAGALALNFDQNRTPVVRDHGQSEFYYRVTVNYNDPNISTAQKFAALKQNDYVSAMSCHVLTAFNAGTTNVLTFGTSTTANELIASGDLDETSATYQAMTNNLGMKQTSDADHTLYAKYTQTGTAATAGKAVCIFKIIHDNDQ